MFWFLLWCWTLSHVYPFQPTPTPVPTPLAGWMSNPTTIAHPAVSGGAIGLGAPSIPVWDLSACLMPFQVAFLTLFVDYQTLRTVEFAMIENKTNDNQFRLLLSKIQVDAHVGGVNDLAFSHPNNQLCVITCIDDKTIKFGMLLLEQNNIPLKVMRLQFILSVHIIKKTFRYMLTLIPNGKMLFIFSTTLDGKIKAWLYDNLGSRVDYDNLEFFGGYGGPMRSYGRMYDSLYFDDVSIYI
ncbi:hypothetical protein V8G54_009897 [Vigna mungo]|uniref:Uncharacterized protein n=1 Tax=Vigna mungo TaxID=3915 RepID=A0AAQ3NX06_VIGMU